MFVNNTPLNNKKYLQTKNVDLQAKTKLNKKIYMKHNIKNKAHPLLMPIHSKSHN